MEAPITSSGPAVRGAEPGDLDRILALVRTAWPEEPGTHYRNDPWFQWDQFRLVECDGDLVSLLKIYHREVAWGDVTALVGGIGDVVTDPAVRHKGYAGMALADCIRHLEEQGYELSMLFSGLTGLYGAFGWQAVSQPLYAGPLAPFRFGGQPNYRLRGFDPASDLPAVSALYARANDGRHGSMIRPTAYWEAQFAWQQEDPDAFSVALSGDEIVGYLRARRYGEVFRIDECISLDPHRACEVELAVRAGRYALQEGYAQWEITFPGEDRLVGALRAAGIALAEETQSVLMVRPIAAPRLAGKLGLAPSTTGPDLLATMPPIHFWGPDAF